MLEDVVHYDKM